MTDRFTALTRGWGVASSRRWLALRLAALAAGGRVALPDAGPSGAKKRKKKSKKKKTTCPAGQMVCGATCVATAHDNANCGGCGVQCQATTTCCDGRCQDLTTSDKHCGKCGAACAANEACCAGTCRDTTRNALHCGGCGIACESGAVCVSGACVPCDVCSRGCPATFVQEAVNAAEPGDTIQLCPGSWGGTVTIRKNLTIVGAGKDADGSVLTDPGTHNPMISIDAGVTVELIDLAVAGSAEAPGAAGISNRGRLTLTRCHVRDHNHSSVGGGIANGASATLLLRHSIVSDNGVSHTTGQGGGIYNAGGGQVTLEWSEVRQNAAGESGGGIHNEPDGVVTLRDSTVSSNSAGIRGGGIANYGDLTLKDSDVRQNQGGGLFNFGDVALEGNSRVTGNTPTNCQGTTVCAP